MMLTKEEMETPGLEINWNDVPQAVHDKVFTLASLVLTVIEALVEHEDDVSVKVSANFRRVMFTVRVNSADVGLAVGAEGRHANALRALLTAACRKLKFHFDMDIGGPSGDPDWSSS